MTCHKIVSADGKTVGFACTRGTRSKTRCLYCGRTGATLLCDHEVSPGKTCDRNLCASCAVHVGPNRDMCPDHARGGGR